MSGVIAKERLSLALILLAGFGLRIWGINFGLPDLNHADEPIVVNHAMAFGTGDLNPHFFKIPPLVSYLLFACYGIYYLLFHAAGFFKTPDDFAVLFLTDPTSFYLIGRIIFGALCGTATVFAFFHLLKRHFTSLHAFLGSLFLAFAFLHVRDSHYIYTDIPLVFVLILSFFPILSILNGGSWKSYLQFGVLSGFAVGTKYNGIFVFAPFLCAHFVQTRNFRRLLDKRLMIAGVVAFLTYSLTNPYGWLDFKFFLSEISQQSRAEGFGGLFHHMNYSLAGGIGWPMLALAGLGIAQTFVKRDRKKLAILSFAAVYYAVLVFMSQPFERYALPILPFVIFFAADACVWVQETFHLRRFANGVFIIFILTPSLSKIYLSNRLFAAEDVRTEAKNWIEQHIPSGSKIALDDAFYMPNMTLNRTERDFKHLYSELQKSGIATAAQLKRIAMLTESAKKEPRKRYELYFMIENVDNSTFILNRPNLQYHFSELRNKGVEYVIIHRGRSEKGERNHVTEFIETFNPEESLARFTPYKNRSIAELFDRYAMTGGPFSWKELSRRRSGGQVIEVYRL